MTRDEAYQEAEQWIEQIRRDGATELDLGGMGLTELPQSLGTLTQLQTLDLSSNQLTMLPEWLGQLTQLQTLDLHANRLTGLPETLGNLTRLHSLILYHNQLTELSSWLGMLTRLQTLNLGNNQFTEMPESLRRLTQLQILYVWGNKLEVIPVWIGKLRLLRILSIHSNGIVSLPDSLSELLALEELTLGWFSGNPNRLKEIPECIHHMKQLQALYASNCELESLPDWLGELMELKVLDLTRNNLTDLPSSLGQLAHLQTLHLEDNPLNPDLAAAYEQGTETLLQFLRERAVDETVLNEAKLILVGEGGVGKSSLLGALRAEAWIEDRSTTHGVEIKTVSLTAPETGVELTLNGWDFGGQPVYRPTHQLFFSAPAVYLVVWEPRKGPEQGFVSYWTKLIKLRSYNEQRPNEQPRVLIVATHGGPKERQAHIDEQALRELFGDLIVGFYHVDSFNGDGLDTLKQAIAKTAAAIPQVGRKVPGSWKRVIDALKQRSEQDAYISYGQFTEICQEQQVSQFTTEIYARILNELGYIIHYGDDEGLKDVVILRAEWLSKAISFVLEDRVVKEHNGLIHHSRLGELWNDPAKPAEERYPPALHPIFLRLMERFDLSYRVVLPSIGQDTEPPDTSLIAQLVPGARPEGLSDDWGEQPEAGDEERTQVCQIVDATTGRPAPAEGLMYQLIVRLHRFSLGRDNYERSRHWQLGLLLDDEYNGRALLEQIGTDIRITVRAAYPEGFLHMLCQEVKWLVEHFWKGLKCQIMVPCQQPCGLDEPGRGLFEKEKLIESRRNGRPEYPCSVPACDQWQQIDCLLAKSPKLPPLQEALAKLHEGQAEIKQGMETGFQSVRVDLRRLISQADEQFAQLMATLVDEARDGPRLFSLTPVEPRLWRKPRWISQKVRLTLWCEYSRMPLPELWNDSTQGVYEFDMPREWLIKVAPYARFVAATLSLVLPVAGSAVKWSLDETVYKQIEENLDLSEKSFSALLGVGSGTGTWLAHDDGADLSDASGQAELVGAAREDERRYGTAKAAQGALLREVQALLKERDPGFGGLLRVQNKRREFLWIHPRFEKEYYPDPPVIPQPE